MDTRACRTLRKTRVIYRITAGVCGSLICSRINSRTVREQVFASSPRTTLLFAQSVSSRTSLVDYFEGFLQNSRTLMDMSKNIPSFGEYFAKTSLNSYNILGEQFAKSSRTRRTVGELFH